MDCLSWFLPLDNDTNLMINRDEVANAITWLIYTGMIATCDLAVNGDIKNISKDRRLYFSDCGIVAYLTNRTLVDSSSLEGLLTETFVFNELRYLFGQKSVGNRVMGDNVCFSTCGAYELDFMLASSDRTVYGIEAKTTKGNPLSLRGRESLPLCWHIWFRIPPGGTFCCAW